MGEEGGGEVRNAVQGTASFSKFMAVLQAVADEPGKLASSRRLRRKG
jgi:hypothetical protein